MINERHVVDCYLWFVWIESNAFIQPNTSLSVGCWCYIKIKIKLVQYKWLWDIYFEICWIIIELVCILWQTVQLRLVATRLNVFIVLTIYKLRICARRSNVLHVCCLLTQCTIHRSALLSGCSICGNALRESQESWDNIAWSTVTDGGCNREFGWKRETSITRMQINGKWSFYCHGLACSACLYVYVVLIFLPWTLFKYTIRSYKEKTPPDQINQNVR